MAASLNQSPSHMKVRSVVSTAMTLLVVAASSCLHTGKPAKDTLLRSLNSQLREEKFEQLYESADAGLRQKWSRETFVRRMKIAVAKLKEIDPDLDLQRDREAEKRHRLEDDTPFLMMACQRLVKGDKSVLVLHSWNEKGEFLELSVIPVSEASKEHQIHGVNISVGKEMME